LKIKPKNKIINTCNTKTKKILKLIIIKTPSNENYVELDSFYRTETMDKIAEQLNHNLIDIGKRAVLF
jgi:hypothetical protein